MNNRHKAEIRHERHGRSVDSSACDVVVCPDVISYGDVDISALLCLLLKLHGYAVAGTTAGSFGSTSTQEEFEDEIRSACSAIDACGVVILVLSESAFREWLIDIDALHTLAKHALEKGKKVIPIIPIDETVHLLKQYMPDEVSESVMNVQIANLDINSRIEDQLLRIEQDLFPVELRECASRQHQSLTAQEWCMLLCECPECADRCEWEKLDDLGGVYWGELLDAQPQFEERCPWEKLESSDWRDIVDPFNAKRFRFLDRCEWGKLNGCDQVEIIAAEPKYAGVCAWDILNGGDWATLLAHQPQFAEHCPWDKLDGWAWSRLLSSRPYFYDKRAWSKMDGFHWRDLLRAQPQLADHCPWINPLEKQLERGGEPDDIFLPLAIVHQPNLLDQETVFDRFEELHCIAYDGVHYEDMRNSVIFTDGGKCLGSVNPWAFVLYYRPELACRCDHFELFNGYSRCILLRRHPQFAARWSMEELGDYNSACWASMYPVEDMVYECFDLAWKRLVSERPEFEKYRTSRRSPLDMLMDEGLQC